jgi:hypothetical protein
VSCQVRLEAAFFVLWKRTMSLLLCPFFDDLSSADNDNTQPWMVSVFDLTAEKPVRVGCQYRRITHHDSLQSLFSVGQQSNLSTL